MANDALFYLLPNGDFINLATINFIKTIEDTTIPVPNGGKYVLRISCTGDRYILRSKEKASIDELAEEIWRKIPGYLKADRQQR